MPQAAGRGGLRDRGRLARPQVRSLPTGLNSRAGGEERRGDPAPPQKELSAEGSEMGTWGQITTLF